MAKEQIGITNRRLYTKDDIPDLSWQKCIRTINTKARPLTEVDYQEKGGKIPTKEGEASFAPGDYLAVGVDSETYPIRKETMDKTKKQIGEPDESGFALFESTEMVYAVQIDNPFATKRAKDVLTGKPGDFLLYSEINEGVRMWIVDKDIFGRTYKFMDDKKTT